MMTRICKQISALILANRRACDDRARLSRRLRIDPASTNLETRVVPAVFVVDTVADFLLGDPNGIGTSLRAAMQQAALSLDPSDTILFDIPGPAGQERLIALDPVLGPLPTIARPLVIDGYSQPGTSVNTATVGTNATLAIRIDGTLVGNEGLLIDGDLRGVNGTVIRGLSITGFDTGILITQASGVTLEGNFVGVDTTGIGPGVGNDVGVRVELASSSILIGGNLAARNLIAGNQRGLVLNNSNAIIQNNTIARNAGDGVTVSSFSPVSVENNTIRENTGFGVTSHSGRAPNVLGNVISQNALGGIGFGLGNPVGPPAPVFMQAFHDEPGFARLEGRIEGYNPGTIITIELFRDNVSLIPQGDTPLPRLTIPIPLNGVGTFSVLVPTTSLIDTFTATATWIDESGQGTSVFVPVTSMLNLVVTNTNDAGFGSLRRALDNAAFYFSTNLATITFAIPGTGVQTIRPLTPLPPIRSPIVLDGYSQLGSSVNTAEFGTNATLAIRIDGTLVGNEGLLINGDLGGVNGTVIRGLSITGFDTGILITQASGVTLQGNFLGVDPSGISPGGENNVGLHVESSSNIQIGGDRAARNLIAGNITFGAFLNEVSNLRIQGNLIGTNAAGTAAIPNGVTGLQILGGSNHLIGGGDPGQGNLIAGNGGEGVLAQGVDGLGVQGNRIGTNAAGTAALGNGGSGVFVGVNPLNQVASQNVTIGGSSPGAGNVVSGNLGEGISVQGVNGVVIQGNRIGTDAMGTAAIPNRFAGIAVGRDSSLLTPSSNIVIGGPDPNAGNVISGNFSNIVLLAVNGVTIQGNRIGTNAAGTIALDNRGFGVFVGDDSPSQPRVFSTNVTIGGATPNAGNVISGNPLAGVHLSGVIGATLQGNRIGTNAEGTATLSNSAEGVLVTNSSSNIVIGGAVSGAGNLISGNAGAGIRLGVVNQVAVQGNRIGVGLNGTTALPNGGDGVNVEPGATPLTIGGVSAAASNVIAFNGGFGVKTQLETGAPAPSVLGNAIFDNQAGGIGFDPLGAGAPPVAPVFTDFQFDAQGGVTLRGRVAGDPGGLARVEFFQENRTFTPQQAQGRFFLEALEIPLDAQGVGVFEVRRLAATFSELFTATTTTPTQGTSIFTPIRAELLFQVVNTNDGGLGSLRRAIENANLFPDENVIDFDLPADPIQTIRLETPLPRLTTPLTIDGLSAPGAQAGSLGTGSQALPNIRVVVDGSNLSPSGSTGPDDGFVIEARVRLTGLAIAGFPGAGVRVAANADDAQLTNLFVGVDAQGVTAFGNRRGGVVIEGGTGHRLSDSLIAGNRGDGVVILGGSGIVIEGSRIGTSLSGRTSLPNLGNGVAIRGGLNHRVVNALLSGNDLNGIVLEGVDVSGVQVEASRIGTDFSGASALGNGLDGVAILNSPNNLILETLISGNGRLDEGAGVVVRGATALGNRIVLNTIGLDGSAQQALGNSAHGVFVGDGATGTLIQRNVIAGNGGLVPGVGIYLSSRDAQGNASADVPSQGNVIADNRIGVDGTGTRAIGGSQVGVVIDDLPNNLVRSNVISGHAIAGLLIAGARATGNTMVGNTIGLDAARQNPVPNGSRLNGRLVGEGIAINQSVGNVIGGSGGDANVIGGNLRYGIALLGLELNANRLASNILGAPVINGTGPDDDVALIPLIAQPTPTNPTPSRSVSPGTPQPGTRPRLGQRPRPHATPRPILNSPRPSRRPPGWRLGSKGSGRS